MRLLQIVFFSILSILSHLPSSFQVILSPEAISISAFVADDRSCVRACINELDDYLQCNANNCLCRSDIFPTGLNSISYCVSNNGCEGPDISTATSRYSAYCSMYSAELAGKPASVPATTTAGAPTGVNTGALSTGPLSTNTGSNSASTSNSAGSQSSGCNVGSLSCGAVGGISFASLAALAGLISAILKFFRRRQNRYQRNESFKIRDNNHVYGNGNTIGHGNTTGNTTINVNGTMHVNGNNSGNSSTMFGNGNGNAMNYSPQMNHMNNYGPYRNW